MNHLFAFLAITVILSAAQAQNPRTVPTFACMSLYWDAADGSRKTPCAVRYRVKGGAVWRAAQDLWFDNNLKQYRGSVVRLAPDTTYEFSLRTGGDSSARLTARTWSDRFPIAKTTRLPEGTGKTPLIITEGGTADGYRLYTAAPNGTTIDVTNAADVCVRVEADYVVVQGLTCRGARVDGMRIGNFKLHVQ